MGAVPTKMKGANGLVWSAIVEPAAMYGHAVMQSRCRVLIIYPISVLFGVIFAYIYLMLRPVDIYNIYLLHFQKKIFFFLSEVNLFVQKTAKYDWK